MKKIQVIIKLKKERRRYTATEGRLLCPHDDSVPESTMVGNGTAYLSIGHHGATTLSPSLLALKNNVGGSFSMCGYHIENVRYQPGMVATLPVVN